MSLDVLPGEIIVKTRDDFRALALRSFKLRQPLASIEQDTQPWIDASVMADILTPMSLNARTIGRSIPLSEVSGDRLDQRLSECGLPPRFPETGSQGSVTISASSTGATIAAGVELVDTNLGLRFECTTTGLYADGSSVPVAAIDTGTQTNLIPGTLMLWSQSIPGLFASCTVTQQTDGTGTSGGRGVESDDEVRTRISAALANPASAGNDAAYQRLIENSLGHGISVQKGFTYPCISGPGTVGVAFTMKPAVTGGSRRPNTTQIALVQSYVIGQMPADDSYLPIVIYRQAVNITMSASWSAGAAGWADPTPWPVRGNPSSGQVVVSAITTPTATQFTLVTDNASYIGATAPTAGANIGFFDPSSSGAFRLKRVLSVSGAGPWLITVDTTNGASDTTYIPAISQPACPWSDSLATLVSPIVSYFGTLGPGEMLSSFYDPGLRQRRNPAAPKYWPNTISSRIVSNLLDVNAVNDVENVFELNTAPSVGVPGASVNMLELGYISAFPL